MFKSEQQALSDSLQEQLKLLLRPEINHLFVMPECRPRRFRLSALLALCRYIRRILSNLRNISQSVESF